MIDDAINPEATHNKIIPKECNHWISQRNIKTTMHGCLS